MSQTTLRGRVAWCFGDDFDVDEIVGVENIRTFDIDFLKSVCMTPFVEGFAEEVRPGDLIVAGRNFGYGHPHDQPMLAMRALGVAGVVAESFAPLFARSETFNGFPLLACPGISATVKRGDTLTVRWETGVVEIDGGASLQAVPPGPDVIELVRAGGGHALLLARRDTAGPS
jgi:3-isopropylmalate/(R)-2-methylmalate dehydratase small subunit